jgi:predicted DNA-binding mobile mystery protein A
MSRLAIKQLDKRLNQFGQLGDLTRPAKGWVRAIRDALGMTTQQLAKRLNVSQSRISALEKAEVEEVVTLATLRRAAQALNCTLVYAIVPRQSLESQVMEHARSMAAKNLSRVNHTMRLENQAVDEEELSHAREKLALELAENPRRLWDDA